ncbi:MAG: chitobiase/beta-hexosaminidase C-terminal domain-containing protein [Lachnospiraceae bacterium]|nr:chitobiase/beta-hexosaminidase C-terminal domain-containing protein [Lachnospiraceae bacterium]
MKCKRCGAELVDGHVYCDSCGAEVQIVPDFNVLEEEVLPSLVSDDAKKRLEPAAQTQGKGRRTGRRRKILTLLSIAAACILLCAGVAFYMHSYTRAFHQGQQADARANYAEAARYYETAIQRGETVEAYLNMGKDYVRLEEYDTAEQAFEKALELAQSQDLETVKIYKAFLKLYSQSGNVDAEEALYESITDKQLLKSLAKKFVRPPRFSKESGIYEDDVKLKLKSANGDDIYYTLDGTDPSPHNGVLYEKPIILKGGETTVSACCANKEGKWGSVVSRSYTVNYDTPAMPSANPSSGTFQVPTRVTLTSEDDGTIYYTWGSSTPTKDSARYSGPITVPEGNNVLSAVVINEHDMTSDVLRCNYVYLP